MRPRSPTEGTLPTIHRFIVLLDDAIRRLAEPPPKLEVERIAFLVHEALAGQSREFHSHAHVLAITQDAGPIEALAGVFHDVVYVQVDQGFPRLIEEMLRPLFAPVSGVGYRLTLEVLEDPPAALVARIFGRAPGDDVSPFTGLNELASAFVAAKCLAPFIGPHHIAAIAAAIEATMPFRDGAVFDTLAERLRDLALPHLDAAACEEAVRAAVRLANRDVGNFAESDPARFLDNTWSLLPETNPALNLPMVYRCGEYRIALQKMEAFLSTLSAERVFHVFSGDPPPDVHRARVAQAKQNITLAVRYLRAKLYTIGLIEAFACASGGDAPVELFLGGIPDELEPNPKSAAVFLPQLAEEANDKDPVLLRLLEQGRATPSSFDLGASPYSAYLYRALGERALMERMEASRPWMRGRVPAREYLASQSSPYVAALGRAMAEVAFTRADDLHKIADEIAAD